MSHQTALRTGIGGRFRFLLSKTYPETLSAGISDQFKVLGHRIRYHPKISG